MPRFFSEVITTNQLLQKIYDDAVEKADLEPDVDLLNQLQSWLPSLANTTLYEDLKKVKFELENCDVSTEDSFFIPMGRDETIMGVQTLPSGLTFLGCTAAGDSDLPIFFIIYWDGEKLRAYIPDNGNLWNHKNYRAFGYGHLGRNEDEEPTEDLDELDCRERFGMSFDEFCRTAEFDAPKLLDDIAERIVRK